MTEGHDLRTDRSYLPRRSTLLPLPQLYEKLKDKSHHWSTCYPAWNLQYYTCLASLDYNGFNTIIETGTNHGCSTALLAHTLIESGLSGHVFTFEKDPVRAGTAYKLFCELGVTQRITIISGDSKEKLAEFFDPLSRYCDTPVRFAFLDADHSTASVLAETEILLPHVIAGNGKIYYDNTSCGPVNEAICRLMTKYGTAGWVEFMNCSRHPNGQAIWQPVHSLKPREWYDSKTKK